MKVLNVISNMDEESGGGATERARQLSVHLSKMGHEVVILTTNYRLRSCIQLLGHIRVIALPCLSSRFFIPLPMFGKISKAVKDADILHLVNHWSIINALVYIFARIHKKPYIVSPLGSLPIFGRSSLLKSLYNFLIGKKLIQKANVCIVATPFEIPEFLSYGAKDSNIVHIPNGINEEDYILEDDELIRSKMGFGNNPFLLFMGRLNLIKGPDLLLEAFCNIKKKKSQYGGNIDLVYIGSNEGMLEGLQEMSIEHSVQKNVHFLGWIDRENKSRIINASLFLVVPSRKEAMSIVALEAGITGKPVLITDQCGFDEVQKVGGGKVVSASVKGLEEGIETMLNEYEKIEYMGQELQKFVKSKFLWSVIAEKHATLFASIINQTN